MSFSQSQVNSKLDSLQETQDSIVSISQWILFHLKHYQESIKLWSVYFHRSSLSSTKKLSLLYLCNDVVQQARRKNKPEFNNEFAKVLPDALRISYSELKPKIDRLLNVWQDRKIFTTDEITIMKQTLETSTRKKKQQQQHEDDDNDSGSGNQTKGDQISSEIKFVNDLYLRVDQLTKSSQGNLTQLGIQSKMYLNPKESDNLPDSSTYISKLNMLEKLGIVCISNIEEIKEIKLQIKSQLDNLSQLISDGIDTENVKIDAINDKLTKLKETRDELNNIGTQIDDYGQQVGEEQEDEEEDEEGIPRYEPDSDSDDDDDDDDKDNDDVNESRKRRLSQTSSSGASTPSKKVAFSESIEVFEGEDQNEQEQVQEGEQDEQVQEEQVTESVDVFSLLSKLAE